MSDEKPIENIENDAGNESESDVEERELPYNIDGNLDLVKKVEVTHEFIDVDDVPINFTRIGVDHEIDENAEDLHIQCARINKIEGLEKCKNLKSIRLIANLIDKLENLDENVELEHLEIYQSCLPRIENISHLVNLHTLDLSFNEIRRIGNLGTLVNLEKLYLSANKLTRIEGLENLQKLKMLELGSNRIRSLDGLPFLPELEELWLGKNKITSMALPYTYPKLKMFSIQSNRIEEWDSSFWNNHADTLEHFQISHNKLPSLPSDGTFLPIKNLTLFDVAGNVITHLPDFKLFPSLEEFWANDNMVVDSSELDKLRSASNTLTSIYLERNPVYFKLGVVYKEIILRNVPSMTQLDGLPLNLKIRISDQQRQQAELLMRTMVAQQRVASFGNASTIITEEEKKKRAEELEKVKTETAERAKAMGMPIPKGMEFMNLDENALKLFRALAKPIKPVMKQN